MASKGKPSLRMGMAMDQRPMLLGRLRMADWFEMPEAEFARRLEELEKHPLFRKLYFGSAGTAPAIRRQRWPGGVLSSSFYEIQEGRLAKGEPVHVEQAVDKHRALLPLIRRIGRPAFERYFVYAEEILSLDEIAQKTGLSAEEARRIHDLLLEIGAQAEFFLPETTHQPARRRACVAQISLPDDEPRLEFFAPYWARGLYQVRYDLLEKWKREGLLAPDERKALPNLLKRVQILNLRQNTLYRIIETAVKLQKAYLRSRRPDALSPIGVRALARRLSLSPSTVSRAASNRSVRLPWDEEAPLAALLPGRREVVRQILSTWLAEGSPASDLALSDRLRKERGIRLSRRTVNAVRHELRDDL